MHGRKASTFQTFAKEEKMESKKGPSNLPKEAFTLMPCVMGLPASVFTKLVTFLNRPQDSRGKFFVRLTKVILLF